MPYNKETYVKGKKVYLLNYSVIEIYVWCNAFPTTYKMWDPSYFTCQENKQKQGIFLKLHEYFGKKNTLNTQTKDTFG